MGRISHSIFLCLLVVIMSCSKDTCGAKLDAVQFTKSAQSFATDLYANIVENESKNVIVSPQSIQIAVALCGMGAGGDTAKEISKGLKLEPATLRESEENFASLMESFEHEPTVKIANKLYVMTGHTVKPKFNEIATKSFKSEAQNLNFGDNVNSANTINGWVEGKTNNRIKDLINSGDLDSLTRMVLVNAIYFKGLWEKKFKPELTSKQPFWVTKSESKQVDMMKIKDKFLYGEFENLKAKAIELPYANSSISMFIILPNEKDGLTDLQKKIRTLDIAAMRSTMQKEEVDVLLPKFKVEYSIELKDVLTKMGMGKMFSHGADFSELLESPEELSVSKVIHKAFIEVNEEGTEAAAATGFGIVAVSAVLDPPERKQFFVNRPFFYALKASDKLLFTGQWKA